MLEASPLGRIGVGGTSTASARRSMCKNKLIVAEA